MYIYICFFLNFFTTLHLKRNSGGINTEIGFSANPNNHLFEKCRSL